MRKLNDKKIKYIYLFIFFLLITSAGFNAYSVGDERILNTVKIENEMQVIGIDNFSFNPSNLTIKSGTVVKWVNHDDIPHLLVFTGDKMFKSPVLDTDQEFSQIFIEPGTYNYFCSLHPKMTAKIIVK